MRLNHHEHRSERERWPFITGPELHPRASNRKLSAAMRVDIEMPMSLSPPLSPSIVAAFDRLRAALSDDHRSAVDTVLAAVPASCRDAIIVHAITALQQVASANGSAPASGDLVFIICGLARSAFLQHGHLPAYALHIFKRRLAHEQRAALIWTGCRNPASDMTMPEVDAIYAGGDGIRDFLAVGGALHDEPDGIGNTLAHHAATATWSCPDAFAAFFVCHGRINELRNVHGRTPAYELVANAFSAEGLHLFADVGGSIRGAVAHRADRYGDSPVAVAQSRGPEFVEALRRLIAAGATP